MYKHSPAPWRYETLYSVSHEHDVCLFLDGNKQPLLMTENSISKLDAHLIAAAPDMLEALKRAKMRLELQHETPQDVTDDQTYHVVCDAINKAEGL